MKGISSALFFVLGRTEHHYNNDTGYRGRSVVISPYSYTTAPTVVPSPKSWTTTRTIIRGGSGADTTGTTTDEEQQQQAAPQQATTKTTTTTTTTIEICLSPGCVADGANEALLKLRALSTATSSATTTIVPGVCCSLCGNGPVAKETAGTANANTKSKTHRKLSTNQKLLDLLSLGEESDLDPNQRAVLEGIDLCLEGDRALSKKKYPEALEKYARGIEKGMDAAVELARTASDETDNDRARASASLQWLVRALSNEASAKLQTKDTDGAVGSAEKARELSRSSSVEALEILQSAYQTRGAKHDNRLELGVLEALSALYESETTATGGRAKTKKITPMEANRRRTLGFRLTELQSTVKRD